MEGTVSSPPNTRIAVVTGGNKGIGLEVCRQLATGGITVVLTARDVTRGEAAVEKLKGLGLSGVVFHQLEVTDASSIAGLADFLKTRFGKLDILVNNAAVGGAEYVEVLDTDEEKFSGLDVHERLDWMVKNVDETVDSAKEGVQTNYYGTNNEEVRQELNDMGNLTEQRLDELLDKFLNDFEAGELEAHGWSTGLAAYKMAKAAMNAYSRILAKRYPEIRVNCAHPGYTKTDMTMSSGVLTAEEGAHNVVKVALLPDGGPTGV